MAPAPPRRRARDGRAVRTRREQADPPARGRAAGLLPRRCSCSSTCWQVGQQAGARRRRPTTHAPDRARVQPAARPDRHRRRHRSSPQSCPTAPGDRVQVPARSTRPATCSPTSPATTRSPSARTQLERTQNDVLAGHHRRAAAAGDRRHPRRRATTPARCVLTLRDDVQQVAKDALGDREGSVVVMDPTTGAVLAMYSYPSLRPQPGRRARHRPRPATSSTFLQRLPRQAAAGQRVPGALHAGLDVQGAHHRHRPRDRRHHARHACSRTRPSGCRRRPTDPIQNFGGSACGGDHGRGLLPQLQHPVRPDWRSSSAPSAMVDGRRRRGASASSCRSTCPAPAASTFGEVDDFTRPPAAARDRRLRPGRATRWCRCTWRWSPRTVANGGQMMKPYVVEATL